MWVPQLVFFVFFIFSYFTRSVTFLLFFFSSVSSLPFNILPLHSLSPPLFSFFLPFLKSPHAPSPSRPHSSLSFLSNLPLVSLHLLVLLSPSLFIFFFFPSIAFYFYSPFCDPSFSSICRHSLSLSFSLNRISFCFSSCYINFTRTVRPTSLIIRFLSFLCFSSRFTPLLRLFSFLSPLFVPSPFLLSHLPLPVSLLFSPFLPSFNFLLP